MVYCGPQAFNEPELVLFERFARALLHSLRGDLSVIQNELAFICAEYGEQDVQGALGRCRSIAATLSQISLARVPESAEPQPIGQLLPEAQTSADASGISLVGERSSLAFSLAALPSVLGSAVTEVSSAPGGLRVLVGHTPAVTGVFRSLSSFVSAEVGEAGIVRSVLSDLVFRHLGYCIEVHSGEAGVELFLLGPGIVRQVGEAA